MQSLPAPPPLQPATQKCGYCDRELPLVHRVESPHPRLNPRTLSRCTICWLLEDFDESWTEEFGDVPVEVMDRVSEFLAKAL